MRAFLRSVRPTLLMMITAAFALGIGLGRGTAAWPFAAAAIVGVAASLLLRGRARHAAILLTAFALGAWDASAAWHAPIPAAGDYEVTATVAQSVTVGSRGQNRTRLKNIKLNGESVAGNAYWSFYGDLDENLEAGSIVTFFGNVYEAEGAQNPDGFDFRTYLLQNGMTFGVYGAEDLTVAAGGFDAEAALARLRDRVTAALCRVMGAEDGAYAAAMLLGDKSLIPDDDLTAFSALGLAHVLAVSGFHVGLLAYLLLLVLKRLTAGPWTRVACLTAVLSFYCLFTGMSGATVRATVLAVLFAMGRALHRKGDLPNLLAAAALVILAVRPAQLTAAGFQMTFGAMLGIAYISPLLEKHLPAKGRAGRWLRGTFCVTVGAQVGLILPLTYWYQSLPTLGLLLNPIGLAYCAALMYLYLLTCVCLCIPSVNLLLGGLASLGTRGLVSAVTELSKLSVVSLWTAMPNAVTVLGVLGLFCGLNVRLKLNGRARVIIGAASAAVTVLSLIPLPHAGTDYVQLSVRNADAAVLRDGAYTCVLDTGEDDTLARYLHQRRSSVDLLILTHLHSDHVGGVAGLLKLRIPVAVCCLPADWEKTAADPSVAALVTQLAERGTEIRTLGKGDAVSLPSGEGTVLWPNRGTVRADADANLYSLTLRWTIKGTTLLTTGDLDGVYELYAAAPADLLKVAHHGSTSSTSSVFLQSVAPQTAILSGGDEKRYASVAERLGDTPLFATQHGGAVTVSFEEDRYTISSYCAGE